MKEKSVKTVFIAGFSDLVARNLFATDFLDILKSRKDLRAVIITTADRSVYTKKAFEGGNITVEAVPRLPLSRFEKALYFLRDYMLDTDTMRTVMRGQLAEHKNYHAYIFFKIFSKLGNVPIIRKLARRIFEVGVPKHYYAELFQRHNPDLIFSTDIQVPEDIRLIMAAKKRGIFTLSMVRSWDNLTSKGILLCLPNQLVVHSEEIKWEAIRYSSVSPKMISVIGGIPHYDQYFKEVRMPKDKFFESLGFDPAKPLIFYAPPSAHFLQPGDDVNKYILELLMKTGHQILVRLPLIGGLDISDFSKSDKVFFDEPRGDINVRDQKLIDLSKEMDQHLADSMYYSDVVFSGPSSLAVDAVVFNKPLIFIGFDSRGAQRNIVRRKSIVTFQKYDHIRRFIVEGAATVVNGPEKLYLAMEHYLKDPSWHEAERKERVRRMVGALDGKSTERLMSIIDKYL